MKNFIYFEHTEGGMETHQGIQKANDLMFLAGWMDDKHGCKICRGKRIEVIALSKNFG